MRVTRAAVVGCLTISAVCTLIVGTICVSAGSWRSERPAIGRIDPADPGQVARALMFDPFEPDRATNEPALPAAGGAERASAPLPEAAETVAGDSVPAGGDPAAEEVAARNNPAPDAPAPNGAKASADGQPKDQAGEQAPKPTGAKTPGPAGGKKAAGAAGARTFGVTRLALVRGLLLGGGVGGVGVGVVVIMDAADDDDDGARSPSSPPP